MSMVWRLGALNWCDDKWAGGACRVGRIISYKEGADDIVRASSMLPECLVKCSR